MATTKTAKNTTGKIRRILVDSLEKAAKGELSAEDGRNIIGLANQISHSMQSEVKVQLLKSQVGHQVDKFGQLEVE
jgi:hypothetical protein